MDPRTVSYDMNAFELHVLKPRRESYHPVGSEWCKKLTTRESGPPGFDSCFCAVGTGSITVDTRPARVSMDQFHERVSTEATGVSRWFTLWIIGSMYVTVRPGGREADAHIG